MAPETSIESVDAALLCIDPVTLSCEEPNFKWIVREHIICLLCEYEHLVPSVDIFTYNDGRTVNLLNVNGFLQVSECASRIPLTIWIHQNYPNSPPSVVLPQTHGLHPFVDCTGVVTSEYLTTWTYPRSNLLDLVRNLVYLIAHHEAFFSSSHLLFSNSSDPIKLEILEHLVAMLQSDVTELQSKTEEDIEALSGLQEELVDRADIATSIILGIENERTSLKQRVLEMTEEADMMAQWLRVCDPKSTGNKIEAAFEVEDMESKYVLESLAGEEAIEDVVYALDKAIVEGVISLADYLKQVRILSREQFFYKAMLVNLRSSNTFQICAEDFPWLRERFDNICVS
ncbi:protein ELC-like [Papaver somniferum]|uniref:protein ELC-like n=1 Tax=Papaver somniferum TaxID=3469 RepID=UPI000E703331|nr:protein ELC-like [Papaver somniferum]